MIAVRQTDRFSRWLAALRDPVARARILVRIRRLSPGNPGDVRGVGDGVAELRIDHGPGHRVYFMREGSEVVTLLAGGDKSTQERDIVAARALATQLRDKP